MKEIVIIDGIRTPIGFLGGFFRDLTAQKLLEIVYRELLKRANVEARLIDWVIAGCVGQSSDAPNIARVSALRAGIPVEVPGFTTAMNCASGLSAIVEAYKTIIAGDADVVLVGGTESMSNIPYLLRKARFGYRLRSGELIDGIWEGLTDPICGQIMGRTAENLALEFSISREEQDKFAIGSHKKAFTATQEGKFKNEIIPVNVSKKREGTETVPETVFQDEGINIAMNLQSLALYPTIFKQNGTVTAGNSCSISDGAASILLAEKNRAKELRLKIRGYIKSYGFAGVSPERMGIGPVLATQVALKRAEMKLSDIDLIELNEAFAAQTLACVKEMNLDLNKLNVNGGAIALGHPVGATGVRIVVTLLNVMEQKDASTGLAALCVGGGQGGALILERR